MHPTGVSIQSKLSHLSTRTRIYLYCFLPFLVSSLLISSRLSSPHTHTPARARIHHSVGDDESLLLLLLLFSEHQDLVGDDLPDLVVPVVGAEGAVVTGEEVHAGLLRGKLPTVGVQGVAQVVGVVLHGGLVRHAAVRRHRHRHLRVPHSEDAIVGGLGRVVTHVVSEEEVEGEGFVLAVVIAPPVTVIVLLVVAVVMVVRVWVRLRFRLRGGLGLRLGLWIRLGLWLGLRLWVWLGIWLGIWAGRRGIVGARPQERQGLPENRKPSLLVLLVLFVLFVLLVLLVLLVVVVAPMAVVVMAVVVVAVPVVVVA